MAVPCVFAIGVVCWANLDYQNIKTMGVISNLNVLTIPPFIQKPVAVFPPKLQAYLGTRRGGTNRVSTATGAGDQTSSVQCTPEVSTWQIKPLKS